ncbi:tyrosinase family protein [Ferruginibacter sp. HRS2-29]|uniref:tyrosinase family protein n=1 Tax=Ferruginibacter sp. HRS2-29 TaxID=2487334 RepID=UPI0020CE1C54|nr:tyrosinase family protein [Ferruginibacter sp. HRS2-29]MCP9752787.1 hypothetical protein [Ferruginibacter sp. HRS2-29]
MKFILKINGSEDKNAEFVGWTPVKCTLTIDGYNGDTPMPVTITPEDKNKSGRIDLYLDSTTSATPIAEIKHDFQTASELTFYVAGKFDHASVAEKDTYILVKQDSNVVPELKKDMMVRVRKNANKLNQTEIDLFLDVFVRLNITPTSEEYKGVYTVKPSTLLHEIVLMHTYDTSFEIHNRESFHPWHRAYLMHLEREMQKLAPEVTIPYWKFDEKAENVFNEQFIGKTKKLELDDPDRYFDTSMPDFSQKNPLNWYKDHTLWGPLTRSYHETDPAIDKSYKAIRNESEIINHSDEFIEWCKFEERSSHNQAHNAFNGRVVDIGKDPVDPLFFLMHSNVDRLWALWQLTYDRYDHTNIKTYPIPYSFDGSRGDEWADANHKKLDRRSSFYNVGSYDLGNFANDELWPWGLYKEKDEKKPDGSSKDAVDRLSRPWRRYTENGYGSAVVPELFLKFPESSISDLPQRPPTVKDTIDYQGRVNQKSGLGFDYYDIPYFDKDKKNIIKPITITREHFNDTFLNEELSVDVRFEAAKNAFLFSDKDQDAALKIIENPNAELDIQLKAIELVSDSRAKFLDTALLVIQNMDNQYNEKVILELIRKIFSAKRSNPNFASRRPFFFDILRGMLYRDNLKLRHQAFEILASQGDEVVEEILSKEVAKAIKNKQAENIEIKKAKRDNNTIITLIEAIFLLRYNPKNQHAGLFRKLVTGNHNEKTRKAAIEALGNDPESAELLKAVVTDPNESFKIREASASSLHNLNHELMNELAAQIIAKPEPGEGIKLFRSTSPNPDEVDFKAGLLNMLTFTGDINALKDNEELKSSLREVESPSTQNKANFKTSLEAFTTIGTDEPTILEQMAKKLLTRIESNSNE